MIVLVACSMSTTTPHEEVTQTRLTAQVDFGLKLDLGLAAGEEGVQEEADEGVEEGKRHGAGA